MKLLREIEEQRIEEAFASKTYGPDNPPPEDHEGPFHLRVRVMIQQFAMIAEKGGFGQGGIKAFINHFIPDASDAIKTTVEEEVEVWFGMRGEEYVGHGPPGPPDHGVLNDFIEHVIHMKEGGLR